MKTIILLFFITGIISFTVHKESEAQTEVQQVKLDQLSRTYSSQFQREKEAALIKANSLGLPVREEFENGRVIELMHFENDRPVYATTYNAEGANLINSDEVYSGGSAGLHLSGNGQTLALWDAGIVLISHDELIGRVTIIDAVPVNSHATHVGGSMIASGVHPDAKGMSPQALLNSYDWDNDQAEMASAASSGLNVSVHPYGYVTGWNKQGSNWYWYGSASETEDYSFGFYDGTYTEAWDNIAYNAPNYLIIAPAGNNRSEGPEPGAEHFAWDGSGWVSSTTEREKDGGIDGFDSISYNSLAKNVITVGAVNASKELLSTSGFGPTDDGRIKPDVVAKGVGVFSSNGSGNSAYSTGTGTSHSAPMIGGSVGLLLEHQENLYPGEKLLSSTLKALILHTAEDLGNPGPDYQFGWGLMNTLKVAETMSKNKLDGKIHIKELSLGNGESITVPVEATGNEPLRVTIAWTDPPGAPAAVQIDPSDLMLINDLDMQLEDESSTTYRPFVLDPFNPGSFASTGDNIRDNVEMVHIESPVAGEIYTVTISHKNSLTNGDQDFSLIITGNEGVDYQRQITEGNGEGWRFLSSPVATNYQKLLDPLWTQGPDNSDGASVSLSESNVLTFNGSNYTSVSDMNSAIEPGSGVAVHIYPDDDHDGINDTWPKTLTVTGMETLGDVDVTDLLNSGSDTFTLLGNPYNSAVSFDNFTNKSQIGGSVYVYDHTYNGGDFRAWNGSVGSLPGGRIAPFQGFFVFATGDNPSLTIPESAKTSTSTDFYKDSNQIPVVHFSAELNEKYSADTWFSFSNSGSLDRNSKDAPYLYPPDYRPFLSVRSESGGTGFSIKNLPVDFDEPVQVPLAFEAWQPDRNESAPGYISLGGTAKLTWPELKNLPQHWTLTLTDHLTGSVTDLEKSSRYEFALSESKSKSRSLPYKMDLGMAVQKKSMRTRFTFTIYPGPQESLSAEETPSEFNLSQNYPNPFNPSTVIRYTLPEAVNVELTIYTIDGQKVVTLVNEPKNAGKHVTTFNGTHLSSGIYFYRLTAGQQVITKKMALIK